MATETWPFAVEKAVFYTAICGILHHGTLPPAAHSAITGWLSNTYINYGLCRFFMPEAAFLSSTGILRASNGRRRAFCVNFI